MRALLVSVLLVSFGAVGTVRAQGPAGVFPVQGTNLAPGDAEAIGTLIAVSYASHSGTRVLAPAETGPALQQHGSTVVAARQLGIRQYIEVQAIGLDSRVAIHAALYDSNGGQLYQVRLTATSMDDMEPVADRIAAGLYRRTPLDFTRNRRNVTGVETRAPNRLFSEKVFGVRTGVLFPVAKHLDTRAALSLEFDARLDAETYFLEFAVGFILPSNSSDGEDGIGGMSFMLGGNYYLSDGDVAPYLGGGVSPRIMAGGFEGVGLTGRAQLGLMLMRWSSSRLYGELGVDQHVIGLTESGLDYGFDAQTGMTVTRARDEVWPTEFSLRVGIGW